MILDFNIFSFLAMAVIVVDIVWLLYKRQHRDKIYLAFFSGFCLYAICLAGVTIFPLAYFNNDLPANLWQTINLVPFRGILRWENMMALVLTIPLGVAWPWVWKVPNALKMLPAVLIPGLFIECMHLLSGLLSGGYALRAVDINEYICYSLGVALGYLLFRFAASLILELVPDENPKPVMAYVLEVCDRSVPRSAVIEQSDGGY